MRSRSLVFAVVCAALVFTGGISRAGKIEFDTVPGSPFSMSIYDDEHATFAGGALEDFQGTPWSAPYGSNLFWSDDDFGSQGVAWVDLGALVPQPDGAPWIPGNTSPVVASISITAAKSGTVVRLDSFDFAAFNQLGGNDPLLEAYIYDGDGNYVWHVNKNTFVPEAGVLTIDDQFITSPLPTTSSKTLTIQWRSPYDIGIDNIYYSIVPEPATLLTWGLGLAGLGFVAYRRRRRVR